MSTGSTGARPTRGFLAGSFGTPLAAAFVLATTTGCDDRAALRRDLAAMKEELAVQRRVSEELRARLERVEARTQLAARPSPAAPPVATPARDVDDDLDALPVVRLEPPPSQVPKAPPLDTRTPLREPTEAELAALEAPPRRDLGTALRRRDPAADAAFADAVRLFNHGQHADASEALVDFAAANPEHEDADNALYLAGLAAVAVNRCKDALPLFEKVVAHYPGADAEPGALLGLGQCEAKAGRKDRARSWLERVVNDHPRTVEAMQAEAVLGELGLPVQKAPVASRP